MGICLSAEEKETRKRNAQIDSQIRKDKQKAELEVKMLLLGKKEIR